VTNGPQPGYKPRLTGLTGHDIQTASAVPDSTGTVWLLNIFFTPHGATLFAELTRENISACPGDPRQSARANCPQRHLTVWLDLTQTDIDAWADPTYVAKVSQPYDLVCLAARSSTAVCSKFLSDPITLQPITGAKTQVGCACTELQANELAAAINSIKAT
jgi:preprotein translocase subunit SecD